MAESESWGGICVRCAELLAQVPHHITLVTVLASLAGLFVLVRCRYSPAGLDNCRLIYGSIILSITVLRVPLARRAIPRKSFPEEKKYRTLAKDGSVTEPQSLPCWHDTLIDPKKRSGSQSDLSKVEAAELFMSVVVPAYNEEDRLAGMLEEAVNYLERMYGTLNDQRKAEGSSTTRQRKPANGHVDGGRSIRAEEKGWEILIVSDGSKDKTEETAFKFARDHQLSLHPKGYAGPWTPKPQEGVPIPPGAIRVVSLTQNRGKGGAVTHGLRHVRGQYVVFADADGATKFDDLGKLVAACQEIEDSEKRAVAVGSRAHMVGSEAVVKVCSK